MNDAQLFQALEKIIDSRTFELLKKSMIIQKDNDYVLFHKYLIQQAGVNYQILRLTDDSSYTFSSLKYAVTWVTLDKCDMIYEANRVRYLDMLLSGIDVSTTLYDGYLKKVKNTETKFVYSNKIQENQFKKKQITEELTMFVSKAKRRQLKQFNQSCNK